MTLQDRLAKLYGIVPSPEREAILAEIAAMEQVCEAAEKLSNHLKLCDQVYSEIIGDTRSRLANVSIAQQLRLKLDRYHEITHKLSTVDSPPSAPDPASPPS